jgi:hypothetical protein
MKTLIALTLIALTFTDCGTAENAAKDLNATATATGVATSVASAPAATTAPVPAAPAPVTSAKPLFSSELHTWQEAMNGAPVGYALASRANVLTIIDSGEVATLGAPIGNPAVWTVDQDGMTNAYMVDLTNGQSASEDKMTPLYAIYIASASAVTIGTSTPTATLTATSTVPAVNITVTVTNENTSTTTSTPVVTATETATATQTATATATATAAAVSCPNLGLLNGIAAIAQLPAGCRYPNSVAEVEIMRRAAGGTWNDLCPFYVTMWGAVQGNGNLMLTFSNNVGEIVEGEVDPDSISACAITVPI